MASTCVIHNKWSENNKGFFNRPRLRIKHNQKKYPSIHAPERTYQPQNISRKYLRIYVRNKGKKKAENCTAKLRVIPQSDEQQYPAIDDIPLAWEGQTGEVNVDTTSNKDIQPHGEELLHIVYSDFSFPTVSVKPPTPIHAVISSKQNLDSSLTRVEHGLVVGDFVVKVTINSDNSSKPYTSFFKVQVGNQWNTLEMNKLSWLQRRRVKLS